MCGDDNDGRTSSDARKVRMSEMEFYREKSFRLSFLERRAKHSCKEIRR